MEYLVIWLYRNGTSDKRLFDTQEEAIDFADAHANAWASYSVFTWADGMTREHVHTEVWTTPRR